MLYFLLMIMVLNLYTEPAITVEQQIVYAPVIVGEQPQPSFEVEILEKTEDLYSDEEIQLIATVVIAEAEGEPEKGQRLVIDTILNRKDSLYFPNTIYDVVYQKNQFSCMWNGRFERVTSTEEMRELVWEEITSRTDPNVIFFTADQYGQYGSPLYQVGNHYFSSYE